MFRNVDKNYTAEYFKLRDRETGERQGQNYLYILIILNKLTLIYRDNTQPDLDLTISNNNISPSGRPGRPGARHHGLRQVRPLRPDLPAGQLRIRSVRSWEQLGQGTLHRG